MIPIRDNIPCKVSPYVSWLLIGICLGVFISMELMPHELQRQLIYQYGMLPVRYSNPQWALAFGLKPDGYLSFLTNLFIHSSWPHIIANVWFMWIFANSIEDRMGHVRFLLFYLFCGLFATYTQWYFDQDLAIPVVGASGAIAGVLGAYFRLYPQARVVIWLPLLFLPIFFQLPAVAFLGFWAIIQFQNAASSFVFEGVSIDVAWWAHLGGFVAGAIIYPMFIKDEEQGDSGNTSNSE